MSTKELVLNILKEVKPVYDLSDVTDIVDSGYLDSFELMLLISRLSEDFGIEIEVDDIVPENFNSADAITAMVDRLKK